MSKDLTLSPISFLESQAVDHVIECQDCRNAFDPQILDRSIQSLYKLARAAKRQLEEGISPRELKLQLLSDGLQENFVDSLISLALH